MSLRLERYWVFGKSGEYKDGFTCPRGEGQFWADIGFTVISRDRPSFHLISITTFVEGADEQ